MATEKIKDSIHKFIAIQTILILASWKFSYLSFCFIVHFCLESKIQLLIFKSLPVKNKDDFRNSKVSYTDLAYFYLNGIQIEQHKLDWNVESKIGSLENADHVPQGGDKKVIFGYLNKK